MVSALDLKSGDCGFKSCSDYYLNLFHGSPEFKSLATLVNNQLVCLRPVGILNNVMFNLNHLFQLFFVFLLGPTSLCAKTPPRVNISYIFFNISPSIHQLMLLITHNVHVCKYTDLHLINVTHLPLTCIFNRLIIFQWRGESSFQEKYIEVLYVLPIRGPFSYATVAGMSACVFYLDWSCTCSVPIPFKILQFSSFINFFCTLDRYM